MYKSFLKRIIDIVFSLLGLIILSPVFILLTLILTIVNKGNPFFVQPRPGKNAKTFSLIKFKTMTEKRDPYGNLLHDNIRLTKIGSIVRKSSLDEIPQLINVLRGEMSLVGPRPLLIEYLPLYNEEQIKRHKVRPGITGWAQVNGRNAISWDDKFKCDIYYVERISCFLDLKIIFLTFKKVLLYENINSSASVTMEKFQGNS
jgi:undecaprenyl phosphate N,N'-diacetylbacillosamine 1-phosphate transferase